MTEREGGRQTDRETDMAETDRHGRERERQTETETEIERQTDGEGGGGGRERRGIIKKYAQDNNYNNNMQKL